MCPVASVPWRDHADRARRKPMKRRCTMDLRRGASTAGANRFSEEMSVAICGASRQRLVAPGRGSVFTPVERKTVPSCKIARLSVSIELFRFEQKDGEHTSSARPRARPAPLRTRMRLWRACGGANGPANLGNSPRAGLAATRPLNGPTFHRLAAVPQSPVTAQSRLCEHLICLNEHAQFLKIIT
jgi:hypothetical protein